MAMGSQRSVDLIEILPGRDDWNAPEGLERQQVLVAGDDEVRVAGEGAFEEEVIVGVTADAIEIACDGHSQGVFQHDVQLRPYIGFPVFELLREDACDLLLELEAG